MTLFAFNEKVTATLEKLFSQHRLVFWYDDKAEMTTLFDAIHVANVKKQTISNNEFSLKYQILLQEPQQKFLLYQPSAKPEDKENWLLDLLLSNHEFHTEPSSLYLQELNLPAHFKPLVQQHEAFFANEKRTADLKAILEPTDAEADLRLKMMAILVSTEADWDKILFALFAELQKGKNEKFKLLERMNLQVHLWQQLAKLFNYQSDNPIIKDFLLQLFQDCLSRDLLGKKAILNKEAYLYVNRWKENTKARELYISWSRELEPLLSVEQAIQNLKPESLLQADSFQAYDKRIIASIKQSIESETVSEHIIQDWIAQRKSTFFYANFENLYGALSAAATLMYEIKKLKIRINDAVHGIQQYTSHWFKIDRLYRKYIFHADHAEHQNILKDLTSAIEKAYGNGFLQKLGDQWQHQVDQLKDWKIPGIIAQREFFSRYAQPYLEAGKRLFVIISDALRYESGDELRERILQESGFTSSITPMLASLPTYTQLGMASLLPHKALSFNEPTDTVFADSLSTRGTPNRTRILQQHNKASTAILADELLKMKAKTEARDFIAPYNVIYIYHNHIDKTGDDKTSESGVFDATEKEFDYLIKLIKHIYNMNGYNMIITADHGYLYQHNRLEETDFASYTPEGNIYRSTRRFVLGTNLSSHAGVMKWTGPMLGFADNTEATVPLSVNRIRIQGAGSRFVHGGAALQEIVVPILEINQSRKADVQRVEIDIIRSASNITSNKLGVNFYQSNAVADKLLPRQIRAAFYTGDGQLISDVQTMLFGSTDQDALAREKRQVFLFTSEASKYNGQDVYLRLEEPIDDTNQFQAYKQFPFRMLISFGSEFDDF